MPDPTTPLPDGVYLDWRGRTYPGGVRSRTTALLLSPDPEEGFTPQRPGWGFEREVPMAEVQIWRQVTLATWRDQTVQVLGRGHGKIQLGYLGHDEKEAESSGWTRVAPGVFTTTVPESEVGDQRQVRREA
ncbi:hypothetical protein [Klenkia marina]|uniref:hypothetical protein n=1 Tax=Klenkia marina TaxID=1960309 RepID=UPI000B83DD6F|nr:hypothetical protein [Klenkia marina]